MVTRQYVVGDIHGYYGHLRKLMWLMGYRFENGYLLPTHYPTDTEILFVGDFVDKGPHSDAVLYIVADLCDRGFARAVRGNHDDKLLRWAKGNDISVGPELEKTIWQIERSKVFSKAQTVSFLSSLPLHLSVGGAVVTHAYFKEKYTQSKKLEKLFMYGPNTGETGEDGYPVRIPWYEDYDGQYGHVYFGHYGMQRLTHFPHATCVDSRVFETGKLSAIEIHSGSELMVSQ